MEWRKSMNRSDYLKDFLIRRGVPASTLTVRELTHEDVQRMGTYELEWHKRENKQNLDAVITPDERNRRKQSWETEKANRLLARAMNRSLTPDEVQTFGKIVSDCRRSYPVVVDCDENGTALAAAIRNRKINFTAPVAVERLFVDMISTGAFRLNPAVFGPEFEQRYGDELAGPHAMSRVSAANLRRFTTRFIPQSEEDEIRNMTADQFYASEHGRALREERNRHSDNVIRDQELRQAEAAVEFFLSANRDYARTDDNRDQILRWLRDHNLPISQNSLQQAFGELKHQLALSPDHNAEYGASRVVDYSDLGPKNPMHNAPVKQHVELVEQKSVKKITMAEVRRMSAEQYEAALKDTDLAPQIETLLANQ